MADIFCDDVIGDFTELPCGVENGRITALGLVNTDNPLTDPSDDSEWTTGAGASPQTIFVINKGVRGEMPRASDTEDEGFGNEETQLTGASHSATLQIKGLKGGTASKGTNPTWTNTVNTNKWYVALAYSEGDMVYINVPCTVVFRPVIVSDIKGTNMWEVTIKWTSIYNPDIYTTPASLAAE